MLGPDLSRVGASRSVSYLIDSIREPNKELSSGMTDPNNHYGLPLVYDTVTVDDVDGDRITGVARNEDTYSVQMITTDQKLHSFLKKDLKEVKHERRSLMPPYSEDALDAVRTPGSDCLHRNPPGRRALRRKVARIEDRTKEAR